ncbi:hypothetical protein [Streptomyces rhizosphaerihabitans]|uniref:hypothetical protein n=1 Tax=Streptomyces rhizosphaerihabitans TaxID=1266770 RepID=UPI0021BE3881|nr:hypothetical protein [Streptomyces rhizosphaerihabitans]MCT9011101.1 hypothetical protein [Streptomyces rhizosphaerihabitans]
MSSSVASDDAVPTAQEAREAWAGEAYEVLMGVAGTYHAVITYKELAEEIQHRTGVRTKALLHNWIGSVLGRVVREARRRGDPPLIALVVRSSDGMVGDGYKEVLEVAGEPPVEGVLEREQHAAGARLACYRHFGATLPLDGGVPALAPRYQAAIERRRASIEKPPQVCGRCFVELPTTGVCDSCG